VNSSIYFKGICQGFVCLLFPFTLVLIYHRKRCAVHIVGWVLATMMVDQLSDLLGTATGGDVALRTWPVLMERSYEAKNPSNAARSFTTVPIGAPCSQDTLPCPNTASCAATTCIVEIMIEPAAAKAHTIFIDYSVGADAPIGELWPTRVRSQPWRYRPVG
jgi:hypothetical protein